MEAEAEMEEIERLMEEMFSLCIGTYHPCQSHKISLIKDFEAESGNIEYILRD